MEAAPLRAPRTKSGEASVTVEVLYFDGCPNNEGLLPRLRELLAQAGLPAEVGLRRIADDEAAQRERFLGSPTVRVNGRDIEPGAERRTDYGLSCRLYRTSDGLAGQPPDDWLYAALNGAGIKRMAPDAGTVR